MQTILIDGDILVYKIAFSMETPIFVVKNGVYKTKYQAEQASIRTGFPISKRVNIGSRYELKKKLEAAMKQIFEDIGTHKYILYLTNSKLEENFRYKLATILPYKENRAKVPKPRHYKTIRDLLTTEWNTVLVTGQEADDALAIAQTAGFNQFNNYEHTIIATIDKDLKSVPGNHYSIDKREMTYISTREAFRNTCHQVLVGDATDNIPGLVRLLKLKGREKEARYLSHHRYIKEFEEATIDYDEKACYNYVLGMYEGFGFGEKEVREIFNLVWLRRYEGQDGYADFITNKLRNTTNY